MDLADGQFPVFIEFNRRGGDFQQGVPVAVEAAGFYVDNDRKEAAESVVQWEFRGCAGHAAMIPVFP